jgi:hypothetical protein
VLRTLPVIVLCPIDLEIKKPRHVLAGLLANLLVGRKGQLPEHRVLFSLVFLPFFVPSKAKFCITLVSVKDGARNVNHFFEQKHGCRDRPINTNPRYLSLEYGRIPRCCASPAADECETDVKESLRKTNCKLFPDN